MSNYIVASGSGWLLVVLLLATVLYPFLLHRGLIGPIQPFLQRMRFHYWLGYSTAAFVFIHAFVSMMSKIVANTDALGLYLATGAFFLVFAQVLLGRNLSEPKFSLRRVARRWHFWLMVTIVIFASAHIALNSAIIHILV